MRFFFDARYIRIDYHDGVSRYSHELAHALYAQKPDVVFIICDPRQHDFLPADVKTVMIHKSDSWKEPFSAFWLNRYHADVVASPLQTIGSIGRNYKLILNQQDMTYYKYPAPPPFLAWPIKLIWRLYHATHIIGRIMLKGADIVSTVSESSKQEIQAAHMTKRPIIVVPNAARDLSGEMHVAPHMTSSAPRNLIYMGAFIPYKNVETLIKTMPLLPGRTLHLLSKISDKRKAQLLAIANDPNQIVFHGGVSDKEYAELLADNAIMVSASRSEGFNLNLIEALAFGTPAVVSDIPVHHEVGGEGALYANPDSPEDFAAKITSLDSLEVRQKLIAKGIPHAKTFNWEHSASVLLEAAERLTHK